jgi:hypothetical protein
METKTQIEEFEITIDNLIYDHFKTIHGDSQDIIFCPDFRIVIMLRTAKETVSYHTDFIDMTKKYTINEIIKESELLQTFIKIKDSYTINVLCQFDDKYHKDENLEKDENKNDKTIVLLNKDIK